MNAKKQPHLKYPSSGNYLELDIWIPQLNIAFEFQVFNNYYKYYL